MSLRLNRYKSLITKTEPSIIEGIIRTLLIHYFFHVSEKNRIFLLNALPGTPHTLNILTPTEFKGSGVIQVGPLVVFGVPRSPGSYQSSYIESRTTDSLIEIGDNTVINNNFH